RLLRQRRGGLQALRLLGKGGEKHGGVVCEPADSNHGVTRGGYQSRTILVLIDPGTKRGLVGGAIGRRARAAICYASRFHSRERPGADAGGTGACLRAGCHLLEERTNEP